MTGICAVVPAAGKGTRLGLDTPKILAPIAGGQTIWSILRARLERHVDHIDVILSPASVPLFSAAAAADLARDSVSISIQDQPRGMGDAVFRGEEVWDRYETLLVIWGDQVHVSDETLRRTFELHRARTGPRCTFPVVTLDRPYVQYDFDTAGRLTGVRQSREGDLTDARGYSDAGTFVLETAGLRRAWDAYRAAATRGSVTGEVNFLPFLPFLAANGWDVRHVEVTDPDEARGINTPADLQFFQCYYMREGPRP